MPFFIVLFFYITISIYQISAVADALKLILMVQSTFLEGILFIVSLFLTFTPLIGPILGIIGATFVWEWNIFFSALLFFWPYLLASLLLIMRKKIMRTNQTDTKNQEIEDAQIIRRKNSNNIGAGDWIRTNDRLITNQELYQLSYASQSGEDNILIKKKFAD